MKNFVKWFGIIALVAVIGFAFTACEEPQDDSKDELDGTTWTATMASGATTADYTLTFKSPNFTMAVSVNGGTPNSRNGTYEISDSTVTFKYSASDSMEGTLSGDTITINLSGEIVFTKQ
jgi:hypothetical protein